MDADFIQTQIDTIKAQITSYNEVLTAIALNPNKSYSLNTGQTTESVTKQDVAKIHELIRGLVSDLQYWYDLLNNTGSIIAGPGY